MILTWWVDVVESVTLSFMTWPVVDCPVSVARQKVSKRSVKHTFGPEGGETG